MTNQLLNYLYMSLLCIFGFLPLLYYLLQRIKRKQLQHEGHLLAWFLVLVTLSLYTIDQLHSVFGFFDPIKNEFVTNYKELFIVSIIKLFYKIIFGIMLMIYGFLGMKNDYK
ncbi:MAG: hypothetical protein V1872_06845 [bacterium]